MKKSFILGNPRSGTSLLRIMLNSHSHVVSPPESGFMHWWKGKYGGWKKSDALDEALVKTFIGDLLTSKKIEGWNLDSKRLFSIITENQPEDYSELSTLVYRCYAGDKEIRVIIDKNNYYINHLTEIASIWSDAYYVHIVRDGRDVACSYLDLPALETDSPYKPQLSKEIEKIADEWVTNNLSISNFLAANVAAERFITIRYEDLISVPEETLTEVLSMFSLSFDNRMMEFYKYNDEPASTLDWKRKTLRALDPSSVNRFPAYLSSTDIHVFEKIAADALQRFGYSIFKAEV